MPGTIMTADDSPSMRQLIAFTLQNAGYQVVEAVDGQDAINRLATSPVQMLITDLNMPNVDGIELIRRVRALPEYKYLPIIMVTTESDDGKKQQGRAAGASGWIIKPFRGEQLVAVAKRFVK
ncbi:MAG TPA: response regulator [Bryobacteraceae bacterium]|nr:response regulator [Bryobacteraceae bacterium]